MIQILIVDDEKPICDLIQMSLTRAGYHCTCVYDGLAAADILERNVFDLILLDVMLPNADGFELMEYIRPLGIPVIFLTARGSVDDRVRGLQLGADDYLAKPFGIRELLARVHALLRRVSLDNNEDVHRISVQGITLDEDAHTATGENGEIKLTPREYELLAYLMKQAGKVLSREDLLRNAWGWEYLTESKTVDTHIKRLRDKLQEAGYDPGLVETVRGYGYRFKK